MNLPKNPLKMKWKSLLFIPFLIISSLLFSFDQNDLYQENNDDFVVVLDAGHGGHDPGNLGNGYLEKNIALNIVLRVGSILKQNSNIKVVYTRDDDTFVDLFVRGEIANKAKADLFVSVHCDSHSSDAHGAGTFVLGLHANEQNFEIAKKENSVIYLEDNYESRYADYDINSPESVIGLTIMQEEFLDQSIALAKNMQENFAGKLKRKDREVKQAGFIVLHQTFMPSVLIETGFLTNKAEGAYLNSAKGQAEMGTAIADAILRYRSGVQANAAPLIASSSTQPTPEPALGDSSIKSMDANEKELEVQVARKAKEDRVEKERLAEAAKIAEAKEKERKQKEAMAEKARRDEEARKTKAAQEESDRLEKEAKQRELAQLEAKKKEDEAAKKAQEDLDEKERLAEADRIAKAEQAERDRIAEETKKRELAQIEAKRKEEEEAKKAQEELAEKNRLAEAARVAEAAEIEQKRKEVAATAKREQEALAQKERLAEEARQANIAQAENERLAEEARKAKEAQVEKDRLAEEAKKLELAQIAARRKEAAAAKKTEEELAEKNRLEEETKKIQLAEIANKKAEVTKTEPDENVVADKPSSNTEGDVIFKVQLLASSKVIPLESKNFNGLGTLSKEPIRDLYRYMYGSTSSYEAAKRLKSDADSKGYPTSYIVAYKDGQRIAVKEARKYVNE